MIQKLGLPESEIYTILVENKLKKKDEAKYVYEVLKQQHPGFSDSSIWDYIVLKKEDKKVIKAIVISRKYFCENRIKHSSLRFYIEESSKKYELFSKRKFYSDGKRKKFKYTFLIVPSILLFALLVLTIGLNKSKKQIEVIEPETDLTIPEIVNTVDILNNCFTVLKDNNCTVTNFEYIFTTESRLSILVKGTEPYKLIKKFVQNEYVNNCQCNNIVYEKESPCYELVVFLKNQTVVPEILQELELFSLLENINHELQKENYSLNSTNLDIQNCQLRFQINIPLEKLKSINILLSKIALDNNLLLTYLSEKQNESNEIITEFAFIKLKSNQTIINNDVAETISSVFKIIKMPSKKIVQKTSPKINEKMEKIGTVTKNGKELYYYRTKEGKLYISETELEENK